MRAPPLARSAIPIAIAVLGVVAIWLAREPALAPGLRLTSPADARAARPEAARPPLSLRLDLGIPSTRWVLAAGFGSDTSVDGASVVATSGDHATLSPLLAPDPNGFRLTLFARTPAGAGAESVRVNVNGLPMGTLELTESWSLGQLALPEESIIAGKNQIELFPSVPDKGVLLDRLWLEPASTRLELDIGSPEARLNLLKFDVDQLLASRSVARPSKSGGQITARLRPLASDYVLAVVAAGEPAPSASLSVFVNRAAVGDVRPGVFEPRFRLVQRSELHAGTNTLELVPAPGTRAAVDQVTLVPLEAGALVDLGEEADRPHLVSGFSVDEACEKASCVWSNGATSRLVFWVRRAVGAYELAFRAHTLAPLSPLAVSIALNGHALGSVHVAEAFERVVLAIPPGAVADGENTIDFAYAATKRPASFVAGAKDERDLAVSFDWLDVEPSVGH